MPITSYCTSFIFFRCSSVLSCSCCRRLPLCREQHSLQQLSFSDSLDPLRLQVVEASCLLTLRLKHQHFTSPAQSCSLELGSLGSLESLIHLSRKFCSDSPLGCGLGSSGIASSQRSSSSSGKLTVVAFVRMNFHYYFSSSFATTVVRCYSSNFDFQGWAHLDSCFDRFVGCWRCPRSLAAIDSCYSKEYRRYWLPKSANFGSVGWS